MPAVTLIGLPLGVTHTTVYDPESCVTFEPNVTHDVDDATAERLKSVEQFGYAFWIGSTAAFDVVASPADVPASTLQPPVTFADDTPAVPVIPEPIPAALAASPQ